MMSINDIIVLLTLIIALIAIISEKNRLHIVLKLNTTDYIIFAAAFCLINYFVFYQSFEQRGIVIHWLYFDNFGFYEPRHYAYLITLASLGYLLYKIYSSFYAFSQIEKVDAFYRKQIENHEISFLLDLLERYHKKDIIRLVSRSADQREGNALDYYLERYRKKPFRERAGDWLATRVRNLVLVSWYNRRDYAYNVLNFVINSPGFIDQAANLRPYFFSDIFAVFTRKKRQAFPDDLINSFLTELLNQKNFWLKKELKESENFDGGQPDSFHETNQILSSLIKNLSVADVNQVWQPFGTAAVTEIELERRKGKQSPLYFEYVSEAQLWEFKIQFTIRFLNTVITEAIAKQYTDSHFWLFYDNRIVTQITETWQAYPLEEELLVHSISFRFVQNIYDDLLSWLHLANKKAHTGLYFDIISCIGNTLNVLMDSPVYPEKEKIELVDRLLGVYCGLNENEQTDSLRTELETHLLKPSMLTREDSSYYKVFGNAWKKFDKIPHRSLKADADYFARLKINVIVPLGLDPDEH